MFGRDKEIEITVHHTVTIDDMLQTSQLEQHMLAMVEAHQRGMHTLKMRDCPLCR